MQHERCDQQHNPSEKHIEAQREMAQSLWDDMESEQPLLDRSMIDHGNRFSKPFMVNPSGMGSGRGRGNSKAAAAAAVPKTASRQAAPSRPAVEASKQRTKTMKDFRAVESGLKRAWESGTKILNEVALQVHGTQEWSCCQFKF